MVLYRPRALRAWWGAGLGLRSGGSGGCGAPLLPAGGRSVRQLDLPDRLSARHRIVSEHEGEPGHGGADEPGARAASQLEAGAGQRVRALWTGLRAAAVGRLAAGRLEIARLVTGGRATARHAVNPEAPEQEKLEHDEAQAEQVDEWQQQQQQRSGDGGVEEREEQEQQISGAVARRGAEERGAALCAPRWRNFSRRALR
eukprot:scaffold77888_cov35-Phaeocystis_antarctica.AAC.1